MLFTVCIHLFKLPFKTIYHILVMQWRKIFWNMSLWVLLLLLSFPPDNEVQCCFASQWLFYCVDKNSSYRFWAMRVSKPKGPFFLVELSIWANSPKSIDTRILCPCLLQSGILAESASKLNLLNKNCLWM